ncbi:MAG: cell division protein FtsQ/DivIB [Candidatus Omnitrophota bacterium]
MTIKKIKPRRAKKTNKREALTIKERIPMIAGRSFIALFVLAVLGLAIFTYHLLYRSDSFVISDSHIKWLSKPYTDKNYAGFLSLGRGENIVKFNTNAAGKTILMDNPELKSIQIVKEFPDTLELRVESRKPVAQVGDWSYYLIDDEGVTLTRVRDSIEDIFPIITGADWRFVHKVGYKDDSLRMNKGLSLLKAIGESGFLNEHTLTKLDISDYRNIAFYIEDGLEIKIGHSNFKKRLDQLKRTLASIVVDKDEIKYIDLRFDDVVLGTR